MLQFCRPDHIWRSSFFANTYHNLLEYQLQGYSHPFVTLGEGDIGSVYSHECLDVLVKLPTHLDVIVY